METNFKLPFENKISNSGYGIQWVNKWFKFWCILCYTHWGLHIAYKAEDNIMNRNTVCSWQIFHWPKRQTVMLFSIILSEHITYFQCMAREWYSQSIYTFHSITSQVLLFPRKIRNIEIMYEKWISLAAYIQIILKKKTKPFFL